MKALVISGGGCKGAFAGGVAEYLIDVKKNDYDIFVGSSTGSLLIPHLAIGRVDKIKKTFTNVGQEDIYSVCPFIITKKKDGSIKKVSINHGNTLKMFFKKKKTFGSHKALRKTIANTLSAEDYDLIQKSNKKVVTVVSNISRTVVEHKYVNDCKYEDYLDWMWASCSFVPFMSLVEKNGYSYADGGFGNYLPIEEAIDLGATEIDVIVLNPRRSPKKNIKINNAFDLLIKTMLFTQKQIAYNDVLRGHLDSIYNNDVRVNFIFTPYLLTEHSFYFDKKQMRKWWQEGFDYAKKLDKKSKKN
ncbi:MAG: patatin-like phospholipase family protein [Saprospiraceae bacterium]|nr:patatin-like phospholipase family protein [Bacteroidia bacterium]NNE15654.1 patatin-like phospholipase family protein [Saprospiraceae bacterium]NNL92404.1 patatin-like phospholipase family protein [Saprospiraceae bacterium]